MARFLRTIILSLLTILVTAMPRIASANVLTEARFEELHQQLRPSPEEPWLTIPWKLSVLDAQRIAAEQNKPIFIWAMDGHPLGCT